MEAGRHFQGLYIDASLVIANSRARAQPADITAKRFFSTHFFQTEKLINHDARIKISVNTPFLFLI